MRKSPVEEGKRWLEQAEEDYKWAADLAERGGYHISCFLAQPRVYTSRAAVESVAIAKEIIDVARRKIQGLEQSSIH